MVITRATEYAIRAVLYMAKQPPGKTVLKKDICRAQGITPAFLTKILQPLIRGGIVGSHRGVCGGFFLVRAPDKITLLDIVNAEEGMPNLNACLEEDGSCPRDDLCPVHRVWREARSHLVEILQRYSFADLIAQEEECRQNPTSSPKTQDFLKTDHSLDPS